MIYIYNLIEQKNVHRFNLLLFINLSENDYVVKQQKVFYIRAWLYIKKDIFAY